MNIKTKGTNILTTTSDCDGGLTTLTTISSISLQQPSHPVSFVEIVIEGLCDHILGVLKHTTAWDGHWGGDGRLCLIVDMCGQAVPGLIF